MTKLDSILTYVYLHNDFYKKLIADNGIEEPACLQRYPIMTRQQIQKNRYNMFSDGYKSEYFSQNLRRQSSSGSSGMPVNVYWDRKDWFASNLSLWRKRSIWYGITPNHKCVSFTLNAFNVSPDKNELYYLTENNRLLINVSLLQTDKGYEKAIKILEQFSPDWLYVQPFVLNKLLQAYNKTKSEPPKTLKYVESVGELLTSDLRRRASDFFKVPIANMYGSEEMNGIAYECPYHHMHILDDNVFVEIKNDNGISTFGEGEIIITNLNNKAMPLIRYNQGDIVSLAPEKSNCPCGCISATIEVIKGRTLDRVITNNNLEINSFMLSEIISEINNQFNDMIIEYKYVYTKSKNLLSCFIKLNEANKPWFSNIKKCLTTTINEKGLASAKINFEVLPFNTNEKHYKKMRIIEIVD